MESPRVQEKDSAWFYSELSKVTTDIIERGNDFKIICPFHDDSTPSCDVNKYGGYFHCFSCNAGGPWNKLAAKLGMAKLQWQSTTGDADLQGMRDSLNRAITKAGIKPPKKHGYKEDGSDSSQRRPLVTKWPASTDWRGMDGAWLRSLGCISVQDLARSVHRIGLPVRRVTNEIIGYTCRAITPVDTNPKYSPLSADNEWREKELPAKEALFLIERVLIDGWDRIVLVEGPVDALRLYNHGIPAVAILGTANWTDIKAAVIASLGLKVVGVLMDNDRSGRDAQDRILATLKPLCKVHGFGLPKSLKDPDQMSDSQILWMRDRLFSF